MLTRLAVAALLSTFASTALAASFQGVGRFGDVGDTRALGISADGRVVVGYHDDGLSDTAFRWEAGVLTALPTDEMCIFDTGRRAVAASADGSTIVGRAECDPFVAIIAAVWDAAGITFIGFGEIEQNLVDVSDDGDLIVGTGHTLTQISVTTGYQVVEGVVSELFDPLFDPPVCQGNTGASGGRANAVSGDGNVIVGAHGCGFDILGFPGSLPGRYVAGSFEELPLNPSDVSYDGSVVVGNITFNGAARWEDGNLEMLGELPGPNPRSEALAVSSDGSVIVGRARTDTGAVNEAFVWDAVGGLRRLTDDLAAAGVDLTGWTLEEATGISADGLTVVGWGTAPGGHEEGWVAVLDPQVPGATSVPSAAPVALAAILAVTATGAILARSRRARRMTPAKHSRAW